MAYQPGLETFVPVQEKQRSLPTCRSVIATMKPVKSCQDSWRCIPLAGLVVTSGPAVAKPRPCAPALSTAILGPTKIRPRRLGIPLCQARFHIATTSFHESHSSDPGAFQGHSAAQGLLSCPLFPRQRIYGRSASSVLMLVDLGVRSNVILFNVAITDRSAVVWRLA